MELATSISMDATAECTVLPAAASTAPARTGFGVSKEKKLDPFKEWTITSVLDVNRMSLKQMTARTDEGQHQLTAELNKEGRVFKSVHIPSVDNDTLFDMRVWHSGFGVQTSKRAEKEKERLRKVFYPMPENEKRILAREKEQFERYNVEVKKKDAPGLLKAMKKVLQLSHERTGYGQAELKLIVEEQKRTIQDERRAG